MDLFKNVINAMQGEWEQNKRAACERCFRPLFRPLLTHTHHWAGKNELLVHLSIPSYLQIKSQKAAESLA